ncbi:MAG: SPOR domain-containing protein [Gammaproteobacteria bacterium]|nr:SPOR domain-containing protein [Gammaproteobacteria bacterium]
MFALFLWLISTAAHALDYYAINIGSSLQDSGSVVLQDQELAQKYIAYSIKTDINGISRYRQRIGFFASRDEARAALEKVRLQIPGAWIDKTSPEEESTLNNWLANSPASLPVVPVMVPVAISQLPAPIPDAATTADTTTVPETKATANTTGPKTTLDTSDTTTDLAASDSTIAPEASASDTSEAQQATNLHNNRLEKLMIDAKAALIEKDYSRAIQIYNRVLTLGESAYKQEAQEFIGVARERNGQLAHATAEYKKYLELYPAGEDADRVRQRLTGLLTAADSPKAKMKISAEKQKVPYWDFFGTAFQFYDRNTITSANGDSVVASSSLATGINYNSRYMDGDYKMRTSFSALHTYDFVAGETDDTRINELYFDMISPEQIIETRAGRQKGRSSGVVGRFDGVDVGYRFSPSHQVKLIAGYPVEFSGSTVAHETDKYFYSIGYNWTGFLPDWDANFFSLQQIADGITDREEIGFELRYRTPEQSFFTMLDYSTAFGEINYLTMVYNRRLPHEASLDIIADYRKSPFLATSSSLQGQTGVSTMGDLAATLTEEQLAELALDRTGLYKSLTALYTRNIKKNLDFNADISVSNLSGTDATTGIAGVTDVPPQEGTGNEYSYGAGLVSSSMLMENDLNIVNIRISQLFNSDVLSLTGSSKYRLRQDWRVGPKLRWETRNYDDGRSSDKLSPSVRVEYRQNKNWQFESEITYESKSSTSETAATQKESSYFIHLGYFYIF